MFNQLSTRTSSEHLPGRKMKLLMLVTVFLVACFCELSLAESDPCKCTPDFITKLEAAKPCFPDEPKESKDDNDKILKCADDHLKDHKCYEAVKKDIGATKSPEIVDELYMIMVDDCKIKSRPKRSSDDSDDQTTNTRPNKGKGKFGGFGGGKDQVGGVGGGKKGSAGMGDMNNMVGNILAKIGSGGMKSGGEGAEKGDMGSMLKGFLSGLGGNKDGGGGGAGKRQKGLLSLMSGGAAGGGAGGGQKGKGMMGGGGGGSGGLLGGLLGGGAAGGQKGNPLGALKGLMGGLSGTFGGKNGAKGAGGNGKTRKSKASPQKQIPMEKSDY